MTEDEWWACGNPSQMLDYHRMKKHPRKLRLLAVACVRCMLPGELAELSAFVLDAVERYADGTASRAEYLAARKAIRHAIRTGVPYPGPLAALRGLTDDAMEGMTATISNIRHDSNPQAQRSQADLVRCVFGDLYRPVAMEPGWLSETVQVLAQTIYDDQAFDRLPILADALMDAGCDNEQLLSHCRREGPHARGCFVLDRILGRE